MERELPAWALPTTIVIGALLLIFFGWRAITGGREPVGPSIAVHPGQYDIRAEIAKHRSGGQQQQAGSQP